MRRPIGRSDEATHTETNKFGLKEEMESAEAKEIWMDVSELRKVLGYLNIGLAIAHNRGVSIGHFGNGDFIELAETVNSLLLRAIPPEAVAAAPVVSGVPLAAGVVAAS